jgi:hypothetical protein
MVRILSSLLLYITYVLIINERNALKFIDQHRLLLRETLKVLWTSSVNLVQTPYLVYSLSYLPYKKLAW